MSQVQQQHVTGWVSWVIFATAFMAISGFINILYGIGGVLGQDWYVYTANNAWLFDSSAWGWSMIVSGAFLVMTAALVAIGNMFGRVMGVILATASLVINAALIAVAPVWSSIALIVDVLVIYALVVHGSEMKHLDEQEQ